MQKTEIIMRRQRKVGTKRRRQIVCIRRQSRRRHPVKDNLLFGYGSMVSEHSRAFTAHSSEVSIATVSGLQRAWNFVSESDKRCYLGVYRKKGARCNGILVEVSRKALNEFDKRESGYMRVRLNNSDIHGVRRQSLDDVVVWTYVPKKENILKKPSKNYPVSQRYMDTVLHGCLEISRDFLEEFIRTTKGWSPYIAHDRISLDALEIIDKALKKRGKYRKSGNK